MSSESRVCGILFADVVGSSKIVGDALKSELAGVVHIFARQSSASSGVHYVNTWGDGITIIGNTATTIAEEALRLQDRFRNEDWTRKGFPSPVEVRIGLDMNSVSISWEGGKVASVSGQGIDAASRIEPKVAPNRIWCSPAFRHVLGAEGASNFHLTSIGTIELPKGAGSIELFDLHRPNDAPLDDHPIDVSGPKGPDYETLVSNVKSQTKLKMISYATHSSQFAACSKQLRKKSRKPIKTSMQRCKSSIRKSSFAIFM